MRMCVIEPGHESFTIVVVYDSHLFARNLNNSLEKTINCPSNQCKDKTISYIDSPKI